IVVAALATRRPAVLCLGMLAVVSALGGRSLAGLDGLVAGPAAGEVTLLSDPVASFGGMRADVRLDGRRLELRADGSSAVAVAPRLVGERITIRGEVQPISAGAPWLTTRHIAGRLRVFAVESWWPGGSLSRGANALRRTLVAGAAPLTPVQRSLYTGIVIGDDRAQPAELADDFLGAGLTHLLAVSGQNVAFALALVGPVLRRLRLWPRLAATLAAIGMFGLITRFEPSVLRASAMAALATTLVTLGGPQSRVRVLALAVTLLLVVDPLLVRSVGFQLSTAATAAIMLVAPRLASSLPGPRPLREAMSVTLAAQLGVAPVLLVTFGPLPVASIPANLLAVPVAGPLMIWGLTGGYIAGIVGGWSAELLHLPTRVLLSWVAEVARRAATLPLGQLRLPHLVVMTVGLAAARWSRSRRIGLALAGAAVVAAVLQAQAPAPLRAELRPGVVRWHAGSSDVLVLGGIGGRSQLGAGSTLAVLRASGVRGIALLVVADRSVAPGVVAAIEARHPIGTVVVASGVRPVAVLEVGALEVRLTSTADRLVVEARPRPPP
ncbi:MAG: ComEC/Rec2 family competence protein, partial [Acidimicrobiales bacterium]